MVAGVDALDGRPVAVVEGAGCQRYLDDRGVEIGVNAMSMHVHRQGLRSPLTA